MNGPLPIQLGPFVVGDRIAAGGMSTVWEATHPGGQRVAIKLLTLEHARQSQAQAALRNEARAVARLDHPNIITVLDFGQVDERAVAASGGELVAGMPWLAMERCDGHLGRRHLGAGWVGMRSWLGAVLDALAHAHARGVIHRDLKPQNILLRDGRLVLSDFGLAHAIDANEATPVGGTPAYMAPEQLHGRWRDYGPWTDLFALGAVAWQAATGVPPFGSGDAPRRGLPPFNPRSWVPEGFEAWVRRLLDADPDGRYRRAADAAFALQRLEDEITDDDTAEAPLPSFSLGKHATSTELAHTARGSSIDPTEAATEVGSFHTMLDWLDLPDEATARVSPRATTALPPMPRDWRTPARKTNAALVGAGLALFGLRALPIAGRQAQRDALWEAFGQVWQTGRPLAVLLHGASGCGKSRLAQWVCERTHELGLATPLRVVHGPVPGPLDGLPAALDGLLGTVGLPRERLRERLRGSLIAQGSFDTDEVEALIELVRPATAAQIAAGERVVRTSGAAERHVLFERRLAALAAERPVVLWIDDAQWGLDAVWLARRLLTADHPMPVLLVVTVRDEALPERPAEAAALRELPVTTLSVPPLAPEDAGALVRDLLGLDGLLAAEVERRTAGNPLFAVQLVGDWVARGVLVPSERGFRLASGAQADLPDSLHAMALRALDGVLADRPETDRHALERAAVLGQDVRFDEWLAVCGDELTADPALIEALFDRRLLVSSPGAFGFAHGMSREVLLREARAAGRLVAHERAAAAMLTSRPGPGVAERLGRHHLAAGEYAMAVAPLYRGLRERMAVADFRLAEALIVLREEALDRSGAPADDRARIDGWIARSEIATELGNTADALAATDQFEPAAVAHDWRDVLALATERRAQIARKRGDPKTAGPALGVALAAYTALGDLVGRQRCLLALADVAASTGDPDRAESLCADAMELALASGEQAAIGRCWHTRGSIARARGDWEGVAAGCGKALAIYEALGNRLRIADNLNNLAEAWRFKGDLDAAEDAYRRVLRIDHGIGQAGWEIVRLNLGLVALARQRYDDAEQAFLEVDASWRSHGQHGFLGFVAVGRLPCAAWRGDWTTYDQLLDEADARITGSGIVDSDLPGPARTAGDLAREAGHVDRARRAWAFARAQAVALGDVATVASLDARG